jgi:hypothetical protein
MNGANAQQNQTLQADIAQLNRIEKTYARRADKETQRSQTATQQILDYPADPGQIFPFCSICLLLNC